MPAKLLLSLMLALPFWMTQSGVLLADDEVIKTADTLKIATVNVGRALRDAPQFNAGLEPLRAAIKQVEEKLQLRQIEIDSVAAELKKLKQGDAEHDRLQLQLARLQLEAKQTAVRERESLLMREGRVYLSVYRQIDEIIKKLAKERGLKLVLRTGDVSFAEDQSREDILKLVNRAILFDEGVDITDDVLAELKKLHVEQP